MRVTHADDEIELATDGTLTFGRSADAELQIATPDDASVSRRAGRLDFHLPAWQVTNTGSRSFFVVQGGREQELFPEGRGIATVSLLWADPWIRVPTAKGDVAVVADIPADERPPPHVRELSETSGQTISEGTVTLTDNELRSVLAIYEGYLQLPPFYRREPNSFRAAAHRLRVEEGKVKADLRRVQQKVAKAGGPAEGGSRYRDALIEFLVSRESVNRSDLALLLG